MMQKEHHTPVSGFILPAEGEITPCFTDMEIVHHSGDNRLARAKRYGKWWLLKGLAEELRNSSQHLALLQKEFDTLIAMQHPGIVTGYAWEQTEELGWCIVMEWIDGSTLDRWLEQPHKQEEKLRILHQLMDAIEYIHDKQITHRDLKPTNIMITRNGNHVKLIDFGLCDSDSSAIYKQPAGTVGYMSQEQTTACTPDIRNDIYSLGCIMEDIQLGWRYHPIVRKCKTVASRRYRNIAAVRRAIKRVPIMTASAIIIPLLAVLLSFALVRYNNVQNELTVANEKLQQINSREKAVNDAIAEGIRRIDEMIDCGEFDTISSREVYEIRYDSIATCAIAFIESYPQSLPLSPVEQQDIFEVINHHYSQRYLHILKEKWEKWGR